MLFGPLSVNEVENESSSKNQSALTPRSPAWFLAAAPRWLDRIDPGAHRRIKGLRLVTAYGIAAMLGATPGIVQGLPNGAALRTSKR
jgi:hypothetical protein